MATSKRTFKKRKPESQRKSRGIPGINIQWPWSQLIIEGKKTVETRTYPLPDNKNDIPIALIETPGPRGKKEAGIHKARIIGVIQFMGCKRYESATAWKKDFPKHRVPLNDPQYFFDSKKEKWGWDVKVLKVYSKAKPAPEKRGIVWATTIRG